MKFSQAHLKLCPVYNLRSTALFLSGHLKRQPVYVCEGFVDGDDVIVSKSVVNLHAEMYVSYIWFIHKYHTVYSMIFHYK